MKAKNKKKDNGNDVTKVMITAIVLLLILIGFLGVSIVIKSSEANSIDKEVEKIAQESKK